MNGNLKVVHSTILAAGLLVAVAASAGQQSAAGATSQESLPKYSVQAKLVWNGDTVAEKTFDAVVAGTTAIVDATYPTVPATSYHIALVIVPGIAGEVNVRTAFSTETTVTSQSIVSGGQRLSLPETKKCSYEATSRIPMNVPYDVRTGTGFVQPASGAKWPSCSLVLTVKQKAE